MGNLGMQIIPFGILHVFGLREHNVVSFIAGIDGCSIVYDVVCFAFTTNLINVALEGMLGVNICCQGFQSVMVNICSMPLLVATGFRTACVHDGLR